MLLPDMLSDTKAVIPLGIQEKTSHFYQFHYY